MLLRHALRSLLRQLLTTSCEQILLGSERDLFPSAGLLVVHPPSRRTRNHVILQKQRHEHNWCSRGGRWLKRWSRCLGYQMTCCVTVMLCYLINLINTINWWGLGSCHDLSYTQYHVSSVTYVFTFLTHFALLRTCFFNINGGMWPVAALFSDRQSSDCLFRTCRTNHSYFLLFNSEFSATNRYHSV